MLTHPNMYGIFHIFFNFFKMKASLTNTVVLPSLGQCLGEKDEDFFQEVKNAFQLLSLGLVCPFLSEISLRGHEGVIDNEVDVRIVAVEELDNVRDIRMVQEQSEMLK